MKGGEGRREDETCEKRTNKGGEEGKGEERMRQVGRGRAKAGIACKHNITPV